MDGEGRAISALFRLAGVTLESTRQGLSSDTRRYLDAPPPRAPADGVVLAHGSPRRIMIRDSERIMVKWFGERYGVQRAIGELKQQRAARGGAQPPPAPARWLKQTARRLQHSALGRKNVTST